MTVKTCFFYSAFFRGQILLLFLTWYCYHIVDLLNMLGLLERGISVFKGLNHYNIAHKSCGQFPSQILIFSNLCYQCAGSLRQMTICILLGVSYSTCWTVNIRWWFYYLPVFEFRDLNSLISQKGKPDCCKNWHSTWGNSMYVIWQYLKNCLCLRKLF